jgi:hypothetical protein
MELENIILSEVIETQEALCSPSCADYRTKKNTVILLAWVTLR